MPAEPARPALPRPSVFAAAVVAVHLALVLPMLVRHRFDLSVFVVAGDRFVDAAATPAPIIVRPHSDGYDGQFYYRLALTPTLIETQAAGVRLDHPAWRMQRILLPVLARLVAGGQPSRMPAALFAINVGGLFATAWLAMHLARRHGLPAAVPIAIAAWPGLFIALTHDTTEILASCLLLGATAALLSGRAWLYAAFMALAPLARETAIFAAAGIFLRGLQTAAATPTLRIWRGLALLAATALPFLLWHSHVAAAWHEPPQAHGLAHNAGWPVAGFATTLLANVLDRTVGAAQAQHGLTGRVTMLTSLVALATFCAWAAAAAWRLRHAPPAAFLAAGWWPVLALMTLLTASGPLVDTTALFRAFTECWVLGWVLAGLARQPMPRPWLLLAAAPLLLRLWSLCYVQVS